VAAHATLPPVIAESGAQTWLQPKGAEVAGENPEAAIKDGTNGDDGAFDAARAASADTIFKDAQTRM
jgi:hypothetical protein